MRIGTTDLFAGAFLVGALRELRGKYPGIVVELVLSTTENDLLRREVDIAVRFLPQASRPRPRTLVARRLGDEPFLLYGADSYLLRRGAPTDPHNLADHEVVVFSVCHPASEWCASAFRASSVALSASSMQVTASAISVGMGLGVLPARAAALFPLLRPLSPVIAQATAWMITHPDLRRVPRIRAVTDGIAALYRAT